MEELIGVILIIIGICLMIEGIYILAKEIKEITRILKRKSEKKVPKMKREVKRERVQKVAEIFLVIGYLGSIVVYAIAIWQMFQNGIATGLFGIFVPFIGELVWLVVTGWTTTYAIILYIDVGFLCVGWTIGILSGMDEG